MTVCIAALSSERVLGVSDRMITAGDIQYEPQESKVYALTNSIVAMYSGDTAIQTEVLYEVRDKVGDHLRTSPTVWLSVKGVAKMYSDAFQAARLRHSEAAILGPLGLTCESLIDQMNNLSPEVVDNLVRQMATWQFTEQHSALIVGVDMDGFQNPNPAEPRVNYGHIYLALDADITCQDRVGFAAIGIGASHAESQFMFAGYDKKWTFPKVLLLAHAAKKRAEASPGVGKATDLFSIGPNLGSYSGIDEQVLRELDDNYRETQKRVERAARKSEQRMMAFDKELSEKFATAQQQKADSSSTPNAGGGATAAPVTLVG